MLGKDSFGTVKLILDYVSSNKYALKTFNDEKSYFEEKQTMQKIDHMLPQDCNIYIPLLKSDDKKCMLFYQA